MIFGKIENGELITTNADKNDHEILEQILADGFKPLAQDPAPRELTGLSGYERRYRDDGDTITVYYEILENDPEKVRAAIQDLTEQLSETDYRVTKLQEYNLAGLPLPYDPAQLHAEREDIRQRIRELELLLEEHKEPET